MTLVLASASLASASCSEVQRLVAQGFSASDVAAALGAPLGAVQGCLQPRTFAVPANPIVRNPAVAGAPGGAAGPPPIGAAGPPPIGAAGPAPRGAAGPPPFGAAGPAPASGGAKTIQTR